MFKYNILAAFLFITAGAAAAETTRYHCTFAPGKIDRPTPTKVVFSVDSFSQYGKLEKLEIPGVITRPGRVTVTRNSIKAISIEWIDPSYEYTPEAKQKGASSSGSYSYQNVVFQRHRFSIFLKNKSMRALARSESTGNRPLNGHSSGTCIQL